MIFLLLETRSLATQTSVCTDCLENETIVEATKTINDLVFQAETNFTNPTVLRNQIDASILGFVNALSTFSPGSCTKKISAQLELSGARVFDSIDQPMQSLLHRMYKPVL